MSAMKPTLVALLVALAFAGHGFRSFAHYRTHILVHFAKLDLNPPRSQ